MESREHAQSGFTLIELLVVVIIIGILAAVAIPVFLSQREKGQNASAKSDLRNLATAQEAYLATKDVYTLDGDALADEGAALSPDVTRVACLYSAGGSIRYMLGAKHASTDTAYLYDNADGVILTVTPLDPGDDIVESWPTSGVNCTPDADHLF